MSIIANVAATDAVFVIAVPAVISFSFMLAGFDGRSVHGFGLLGGLSIKQRYIGALGGFGMIFVAVLSICLVKGVSPAQLWVASIEWFQVGFIGVCVGSVGLLTLLSPALLGLTLLKIHFAKKKEADHRTILVQA